jgi:PBP1b-binding outer membrane lipoprotein LpoB
MIIGCASSKKATVMQQTIQENPTSDDTEQEIESMEEQMRLDSIKQTEKIREVEWDKKRFFEKTDAELDKQAKKRKVESKPEKQITEPETE